MSISGLSAGFTNPLASLRSPAVGGALDKSSPPDPAAEAAEKAEAAKSKNRAILDEIKEKGIYAWAQEQKLKKLEEMARQRALSDRGLTEADLAKMPESERAATEDSIQEIVAQMVKEALEKNMAGKSAANADGQKPAGPMIIDISV